MRKEQTKVYVLMLSKEFPKEHPKAGEQTGFKEKLELALKAQEQAEDVLPAVVTAKLAIVLRYLG